jgi:hypothetical protein
VSTLREPARIEAQIEATERWIASLKRRIVHGEEMLGALRGELAAVQIENPGSQAAHFEERDKTGLRLSKFE